MYENRMELSRETQGNNGGEGRTGKLGYMGESAQCMICNCIQI